MVAMEITIRPRLHNLLRPPSLVQLLCRAAAHFGMPVLLLPLVFLSASCSLVESARTSARTLTASVAPELDLGACPLLFASFSFLPAKGKIRDLKEQATAFTHSMSKLMFKRHHTYPLSWFFASALMTNPGSCTAILTDPEGAVPAALQSVVSLVFRGKGLERLDSAEGDNGGNMLWKLRISRRRTYIQFLEHLAAARSRADVLVMDPDMLVLAPVPAGTFAGGFHVGLVANKEFARPTGSGRRMVQGGFVAVPAGMYDQAAAFFRDTVTNWFAEPDPTDVGDQTILLKTIGLELLPRLRELSTDDTGALLLCNRGRSRVWIRGADKLNNAFDTGLGLREVQSKGVLVLHFKGHLKAHMRQRFRELCRQHGQEDWCQELSAGETAQPAQP